MLSEKNKLIGKLIKRNRNRIFIFFNFLLKWFYRLSSQNRLLLFFDVWRLDWILEAFLLKVFFQEFSFSLLRVNVSNQATNLIYDFFDVGSLSIVKDKNPFKNLSQLWHFQDSLLYALRSPLLFNRINNPLTFHSIFRDF